MKIYLDNCCYNRPFDDQNQDRIRLESEAILIILKWAQCNKLKIIGSDIIFHEIDKMPDVLRKEEVYELLPDFKEIIDLNKNLIERAFEITALSFTNFDALHLACAEFSKADFFLTTDDAIIKKYFKHKSKLYVKCENPLTWLNERLRQ